MQTNRHTIRHLSPDLLMEAKILAIQSRLRLGDVINDALDTYLDEMTQTDEDQLEANGLSGDSSGL